MNKKPLFAKSQPDLYQVLREKVDLYFREQKISQKADRLMYAKTFFLISLLAITYTFLFWKSPGGWAILWKYLILGIAVALTTMNISHDGLHGSYFKSPFFNRLLGYLMDICGKSSYFWGKEHVVDHHTFTNIGGHDHDLSVENPFLRLCPLAPLKPYHRFQHWYAPLLYCVYPLFAQWVEIKKAFQLRDNHVKSLFFFLKIVHVILFVIVPKELLHLTWVQIALGYICYGVGVGVTLAFVFQLAHIVENVAFPEMDNKGNLNDTFLLHQLNTTANFSTKSRSAHFFFGGLNFQVEHHLFPHVSHIHLFKLSPFVKKTLQELGLPYHENPTLFGALKSHFRALKKLGRLRGA